MEAEVKVKDKKQVEISYPSGRVVRYFYNHVISEIQMVLPIKEENERDDKASMAMAH